MIELSVKVSDDDTSLVQKHLIHEEGLSLSHDDPTLTKLVNQAIEAFGEGAKDVIVRIKYTW
jgi:hypothetical protein